MSIEGNIAIICITENGKNLARKIESLVDNCVVYQIKNKKGTLDISQEDSVQIIQKKLSDFVGEVFNKFEYIIFIMATGIVVRSIAPYIISKFSDPAILVIDEKGQNVISLLSGHIGGANSLTHYISSLINANPVITTATDVNQKASLDMIAKKLNAYIDNFRENVKEVNSMLVNGKCVGLYVEEGYQVDTRGFKLIKSSKGLKDSFLNKDIEKIVIVSNKINFTKDIESLDVDNNFTHNYYREKIIKVIPKDIVIGIGCRRYTDSKLMFDSLLEFFEVQNIDIKAVKIIGSIDLKKDEKAIIDLAKKLKAPFKTFSIDEISKVDDMFDKSDFVKKNVGVYSVAEPVAYLLSKGNLIVEKHKYKGITFSVGRIKI
ncbi:MULTISPECIES: cobalt-precorrin 5A hydrolase [unclassified Clostridioides]|uniref:cobalt-precorrin 5A hydrolase n=1 Tax=unclassified Clostridioides TaxID=2635829 RepID=UPI001D0C4E5A|nr:cobalt-precorrin 5A hydrolase [Clostridioides sp. ES-S-0001-02]MCC0705695.1 cobalt-precorrin 5A hydrolase [Clostridioides sp. ES-S-0190-01]MCC0764389.1 cobalt-precorrin 5A hydrolase [Clostridioides sp. ES-S-0006-03]